MYAFYILLAFTVSASVEEAPSEVSVSLTDLQTRSDSRRKSVLLSPRRDDSQTASTSTDSANRVAEIKVVLPKPIFVCYIAASI